MASSLPNAANLTAAVCDNTRCEIVLKAFASEPAALFKYEQMAAGLPIWKRNACGLLPVCGTLRALSKAADQIALAHPMGTAHACT
jgi:hypothetical protein